jgi:hypothetical protein
LAFSQKDKQLTENRWEIHQILSSIISSQRFTMVPFYKKGVKFKKQTKIQTNLAKETRANKLSKTKLAKQTWTKNTWPNKLGRQKNLAKQTWPNKLGLLKKASN